MGTVREVDQKGATLQLAEHVSGFLKVAEMSRDRADDARVLTTVGEEIEAKIILIDHKNRTINLSIKPRMCQKKKLQ